MALGTMVWHVYLHTVASFKVSARGWDSGCCSCTSGGWRGLRRRELRGSSCAGGTTERDLPVTVIHKESSAIRVLQQRRGGGRVTTPCE